MSYAQDWQKLISQQPETAALVGASVAQKVSKSDLVAIVQAHERVQRLRAELEQERKRHADLVDQVANLPPDHIAATPKGSKEREQQLADLLSGLIAVSNLDFTEHDLRSKHM